MKYLQKLAGGIDTTLVLHAILRQPELWESVLDNFEIYLRTREQGKWVNWFTFDLLPQFRQFIFGILTRVEAEQLGTVCLARIPSGKVAHFYEVTGLELYFLTVQTFPGVSAQVQDEGIMLLAGDAWWAETEKEKGVTFTNNSADDFVVLLIWATPSSPATYVPEPKL